MYQGSQIFSEKAVGSYTNSSIEGFVQAFQPTYGYVQFPWEESSINHKIGYKVLGERESIFKVIGGQTELVALGDTYYFLVLWVMQEYSEKNPLPCKARTWADAADFHKAFMIFNRELKTYEQYRQALFDFCTTTDKGRLRADFLFSQEMFDGKQSLQKDNWGVPVEIGITQRESVELIDGVFHATYRDRGSVTAIDKVYDAELFYKTRLCRFMRLLFIS